MSLEIDVDKVTDVLLTDGKWYKIVEGSFGFDAYEFYWEDGSQDGFHWTMTHQPIASLGFEFISNGKVYSGPITSIVATRRSTAKDIK